MTSLPLLSYPFTLKVCLWPGMINASLGEMMIFDRELTTSTLMDLVTLPLLAVIFPLEAFVPAVKVPFASSFPMEEEVDQLYFLLSTVNPL